MKLFYGVFSIFLLAGCTYEPLPRPANIDFIAFKNDKLTFSSDMDLFSEQWRGKSKKRPVQPLFLTCLLSGGNGVISDPDSKGSSQEMSGLVESESFIKKSSQHLNDGLAPAEIYLYEVMVFFERVLRDGSSTTYYPLDARKIEQAIGKQASIPCVLTRYFPYFVPSKYSSKIMSIPTAPLLESVRQAK